MELKAFLVENGYLKRINKFGIEVYGNSHFIKMFYDKYNNNPYYNYCLESSIKGDANIQLNIKNFKTIEEAESYFNRNKNKILKILIKEHKKLKEELQEAIKEYKLADFDFLDKPLKILDKEAPLIFEIKKYDKYEKVRLFNGFYWKEEKEKTKDDCIEIKCIIYKKWCAKEELSITQTGNMMFSSWWSVDVEPIHPNKSHTPFNKTNFEKEMKEAREYYNKNRTKNIKNGHDSFSFPKIKWFDEELIK